MRSAVKPGVRAVWPNVFVRNDCPNTATYPRAVLPFPFVGAVLKHGYGCGASKTTRVRP